MLLDPDIRLGKAQLDIAQKYIDSGIDVFIHVNTLPPLKFRSVISSDETGLATVSCYASDQNESEIWNFRLKDIRGIEIVDD